MTGVTAQSGRKMNLTRGINPVATVFEVIRKHSKTTLHFNKVVVSFVVSKAIFNLIKQRISLTIKKMSG